MYQCALDSFICLGRCTWDDVKMSTPNVIFIQNFIYDGKCYLSALFTRSLPDILAHHRFSRYICVPNRSSPPILLWNILYIEFRGNKPMFLIQCTMIMMLFSSWISLWKCELLLRIEDCFKVRPSQCSHAIN